jgi:hypothetical protein
MSTSVVIIKNLQVRVFRPQRRRISASCRNGALSVTPTQPTLTENCPTKNIVVVVFVRDTRTTNATEQFIKKIDRGKNVALFSLQTTKSKTRRKQRYVFRLVRVDRSTTTTKHRSVPGRYWRRSCVVFLLLDSSSKFFVFLLLAARTVACAATPENRSTAKHRPTKTQRQRKPHNSCTQTRTESEKNITLTIGLVSPTPSDECSPEYRSRCIVLVPPGSSPLPSLYCPNRKKKING